MADHQGVPAQTAGPRVVAVEAHIRRAPRYDIGNIALNASASASLMAQLGAAPGDVVRISTGLGRATYCRLETDGPAADGSPERNEIGLDRLVRSQLRCRVNDVVDVARADLPQATRIRLTSPVDVSRGHGLREALISQLRAARTPCVRGSKIYSRFGVSAGMLFEVAGADPPESVAGPATEIDFETPTGEQYGSRFEVGYEDVGGLDAELKLLRELIETPLTMPFIYRYLGIRPPRGVLLCGPPGSGKTHLARALANEFHASIYLINGPSFVGTMRGETEANLKAIFDEAAHHAPSIVVIDEIDGIAPHRRDAGTQTDVRTVTMLLAAMDGLSDVDGVVVIGTTNRVDQIDPALRRPGRFDRELTFSTPDKTAREQILAIHVRDMPLAEDMDDLGEIAAATGGFVGADIVELCREAGLAALRRLPSAASTGLAEAEVVINSGISVDRKDFEAALARVRPAAGREKFVRDPFVPAELVGMLSEREFLDFLDEEVRREAAASDFYRTAQFSDVTRSGTLLVGPSGSGKSALVNTFARDSGRRLCVIDGPEIFGRWLGESEEAIRHVFEVARRLSPSILFLDQLDAVAPIRGMDSGTKTTERVVNQLLTELDSISADGRADVLIIGATSRPELVDPAILQPPRLSNRISMSLPDGETRGHVISTGMKQAGLEKYCDEILLRQLTELSVDMSIGAIRHTIARIAVEFEIMNRRDQPPADVVGPTNVIMRIFIARHQANSATRLLARA